MVRALFVAAEAQGAPRAALLQAAALSETQLGADEVWVPRSFLSRVCEAVLAVTGDPAFGLHWAERLTESSFPPITNLFIHSTSLRDAFDALQRFTPLLASGTKIEVIEGPNALIVKRISTEQLWLNERRFCAEMFTVGLLNQIRRMLRQVSLSAVSFDYPAPSYSAEYRRVFERPVQFNQPFTGLIFDSSLLNRRSIHQDVEMQGTLRELAERRLSRISRTTPYSQRVRDVLICNGGKCRTDMKSVARALHTSVRSLRRRLKAEGVAYGFLLNATLASMASDMLSNEALTIGQVSEAMGFSDRSTFHRAFKRWTGRTPSEYRDGGRCRT